MKEKHRTGYEECAGLPSPLDKSKCLAPLQLSKPSPLGFYEGFRMYNDTTDYILVTGNKLNFHPHPPSSGVKPKVTAF